MPTPTPTDLARLIANAVTIAEEAGRILLEGWSGTEKQPGSLASLAPGSSGTEKQPGSLASLAPGWQGRPATKTKSAPNDLVTEYDQRSEALITERLRAAYPAHALVGEEGAREGDPSGPTWYVDPLDGTMNFAHAMPFFAVSIGLCDGAAPVAGVVHAPALGWTFSGAVGTGAARNGSPIAVSATESLASSLLATGFPHVPGAPHANVPEWAAFLAASHGVRRLGSAALDLALVSCGWFDGHWERHVGAWDLAAGAALVLAAGGRVSDIDGGPFDPRTGRIIASNGHVHDEMRALLERVARSDAGGAGGGGSGGAGAAR